METIADRTADSTAARTGSTVAGRVIEIIPVPYTGTEEDIIITQPPVNIFMLEKPA